MSSFGAILCCLGRFGAVYAAQLSPFCLHFLLLSPSKSSAFRQFWSISHNDNSQSTIDRQTATEAEDRLTNTNKLEPVEIPSVASTEAAAPSIPHFHLLLLLFVHTTTKQLYCHRYFPERPKNIYFRNFLLVLRLPRINCTRRCFMQTNSLRWQQQQ